MAAEPRVIGPENMQVLKTTSTPVVYTGHPNRGVDQTPIHLAASNDHDFVGVVQMLVQKGADVNLTDTTENQATALNMAAEAVNLRICRFLIRHGADVSLVDAHGLNALHCAVYVKENEDGNRRVQRRIAIINLLLNRGVAVDSRTITGATPLMYAVSGFGYFEIYRRLLEAGADLDITDRKIRTCLQHCLATYSEEKTHIMVDLIKNGVSLRNLDNDGKHAVDYILNSQDRSEEQKTQQLKELIKFGRLIEENTMMELNTSRINIDGIADFDHACYSELIVMETTRSNNYSSVRDIVRNDEEIPPEIFDYVYEDLVVRNYVIYRDEIIDRLNTEYLINKLYSYEISVNVNQRKIAIHGNPLRHLCGFLSNVEIFNVLRAPFSD